MFGPDQGGERERRAVRLKERDGRAEILGCVVVQAFDAEQPADNALGVKRHRRPGVNGPCQEPG